MASAYHRLEPAEKARCVIYGDNYGKAAALRYYGRRYGLPPAISGHNNFCLWGPGERECEVLIAVGLSREDLESSFSTVAAAGIVESPYARLDESNLTVYVARNPKRPLSAFFGSTRIFI